MSQTQRPQPPSDPYGCLRDAVLIGVVIIFCVLAIFTFLSNIKPC